MFKRNSLLRLFFWLRNKKSNFQLRTLILYPCIVVETGRNLILDERALQEISRQEMERQREERMRAKTAPNARERRRNWDMNSIEIKTTAGDRRKVKAPGNDDHLTLNPLILENPRQVLWQTVCLFVLLLFVPVNSYGHGGTVSSPNHTFSWASLNKRLTILCTHTFTCN